MIMCMPSTKKTLEIIKMDSYFSKTFFGGLIIKESMIILAFFLYLPSIIYPDVI